MKPISISAREARRIAIIASGLHAASPYGGGKNAVQRVIDHLGYVQVDTISVVLRAHHHVLGIRVPNYKKKHLHDLQVKDRMVLESWAHAAAFVPMSEYRYTLPINQMFKDKRDQWPDVEESLKRDVLKRVHQEGPLMARDFENTDASYTGGWWNHKPAKRALERLFLEGDLLISHRKNFQKVFDLPERVIPDVIDTTFPETDEYAKYLMRRALRSMGLVRPAEAAYLRKGMGTAVTKAARIMKEQGEIEEVAVGRKKDLYYLFTDWKPARITKKLKILSPFDNFIIQRQRLNDLFDFNYQIECYVPKDKRVYGYFCLPILFGDKLVGRVDAKVHRRESRLEIIQLFVENDDALTKIPFEHWKKGFDEFAQLNDCSEIVSKQKSSLLEYLSGSVLS